MVLFLSEHQVEFYSKNGYLVIENFWSEDVVDKLRQSINEVIDNLDLTSSKSVFSTKEQHRRKADDYFLNSGREIRFFWEEKAIAKSEDAVASGGHSLPLRECINKIGHGLHGKWQMNEDNFC